MRPITLAYHGVNHVEAGEDPSKLVVTPDRLHDQLGWLRRRGYRFETARELAARGSQAPSTAVITFDDGWADALTTAQLLSDWGAAATFYVCPGWWGGQHPDVTGPAGRLLTRAETQQLAAAGADVGSHSMSHPDLTKLADGDLKQELTASKHAIEDAIGIECTTFAYPFGLHDGRVRGAVESAGYKLAFAWLPGPWDRFAAPRLPGPPRHGPTRLALKMLGVRRRRG